MFDSSGNLYGTTLRGGTTGRGTVYRMSNGPSGWSERLLYSFQCCKGHIYSPFGGVVLDPAGNIYGTATLGSGYGGIFKLTPNGGSYTENSVLIFHPLEGWDSQASMIRDGAGNLYGTVMFTASGAGGVFQFVP